MRVASSARLAGAINSSSLGMEVQRPTRFAVVQRDTSGQVRQRIPKTTLLADVMATV